MPGRKNKTALAAIPPDDVLLKRIANGELLVDISDSLGVSHDTIGQHLRKVDKEAYRKAREIGCETRLYLSRRAITEAKGSRDAIALAGAREEFRADGWFAEREFPERWGAKQHLTVEHVGDLGDKLRRAKERVIDGESVDVSDRKPVDNLLITQKDT